MTIDEFDKIELRVGTVRSAERVEGSSKLLKFQIDAGAETRQILSGIGKQYEPEALIGRQVVFIANLEPRMLMGLESQGMILAASAGEKLALLGVDQEIAPGAAIH